MLVTALTAKRKGENQWRRPSTEELINKIQQTSMEYYSTVKKYETLPFVEKWLEFQDTMLSEINQTQSNSLCYFPLGCRCKNNNDLKVENGLLGTKKEVWVWVGVGRSKVGEKVRTAMINADCIQAQKYHSESHSFPNQSVIT